jgi:hypothetical protein
MGDLLGRLTRPMPVDEAASVAVPCLRECPHWAKIRRSHRLRQEGQPTPHLRRLTPRRQLTYPPGS